MSNITSQDVLDELQRLGSGSSPIQALQARLEGRGFHPEKVALPINQLIQQGVLVISPTGSDVRLA